MSRAATPSLLIAAITRRMADELAASARLAVEPSFVTPNEKLARSGLALIVASALTLIVLFTGRKREPHAVVRPSTSSAITARTSVERFIIDPPGWRLETYRRAGRRLPRPSTRIRRS